MMRGIAQTQQRDRGRLQRGLGGDGESLCGGCLAIHSLRQPAAPWIEAIETVVSGRVNFREEAWQDQ